MSEEHEITREIALERGRNYFRHHLDRIIFESEKVISEMNQGGISDETLDSFSRIVRLTKDTTRNFNPFRSDVPTYIHETSQPKTR